MARAMQEMFSKQGFCFLEVISPCPTLYQRRNKMGDGLDTMIYYKEHSKVKNGCPTSEVSLSKGGEILSVIAAAQGVEPDDLPDPPDRHEEGPGLTMVVSLLAAALAQCCAQHRIASGLVGKLNLPCLQTDSGYAAADLESCDAAITGCDALVAQTGSILVTAKSTGGRALSVLPPHHVVIAQRSEVVPDLASALQLARIRYAPDWPSFMSFITGPSRTGDIERILVLGAHGPKKLTIFLLP